VSPNLGTPLLNGVNGRKNLSERRFFVLVSLMLYNKLMVWFLFLRKDTFL